MKKRKKIIKIAIDSPAAAGAGTQAKLDAVIDMLQILRFLTPQNIIINM